MLKKPFFFVTNASCKLIKVFVCSETLLHLSQRIVPTPTTWVVSSLGTENIYLSKAVLSKKKTFVTLTPVIIARVLLLSCTIKKNKLECPLLASILAKPDIRQ
jgi:hypothetical protein